jgi:hypothetical protein
VVASIHPNGPQVKDEGLNKGKICGIALMSRHFYKTSFIRRMQSGSKKGKKGKKGKKVGLFALFALFAFFASTSPITFRP